MISRIGRPCRGGRPKRHPIDGRFPWIRQQASLVAVLAAIALAAAASWSLPTATRAATPAPSPAAGTLRVDPPTATVAGGQTLTVSLIQHAAVATTGSQANVVFDQKLLQIISVKPGPAYASALFLYGRTTDGTNKSLSALIANANATGALRNLATFMLPGSGSVPAGDAVFVTILFQAVAGPGGTTSLDLQELVNGPLAMLDENGGAMTVTATAGTVTVQPSAGGSSPVPSSSTDVQVPSSGAASPGGSGAAAGATLTVVPASPHVAVGGLVTVALHLNADVDVASVAADLVFDKSVVGITKVEPGPAWSQGGVLIAGAGNGSIFAAIMQANPQGVLAQAGMLLGAGSVPAGDGVYLIVTLQGLADGTTTLSLANPGITDANGNAVTATMTDAQLAVGKGSAAGGFPPLLAGLPALALLAGAVFVVRDRRPAAARGRRTATAKDLRAQRWPYVVGLVLGLVPVGMFAGMLWLLVANALPALDNPGLAAMLSDQFASRYSAGNVAAYGLLPALWGTFEIAGIALIVALPVSLAMALVSAEFPMGPVGRLLRPLLGIFSGIPPIVYAIAGLGFVTVLMIPKFAANSTFGHFDPVNVGVAAGAWPPTGVPPVGLDSYPWDAVGGPNSTLLGGLLIALLVIPFLAPLIYDAMQNVPAMVREASFAVGATRSYTLRRVILPIATPGIVAAASLALLKALGDALIVGFAVGFEANHLPSPLFDVFERTPSLAAEGAGLVGNFEAGGSCRAVACPTGYASALLLLAISALVVLGTTYLQARLRRRARA